MDAALPQLSYLKLFQTSGPVWFLSLRLYSCLLNYMYNGVFSTLHHIFYKQKQYFSEKPGKINVPSGQTKSTTIPQCKILWKAAAIFGRPTPVSSSSSISLVLPYPLPTVTTWPWARFLVSSASHSHDWNCRMSFPIFLFQLFFIRKQLVTTLILRCPSLSIVLRRKI